MATVVPTRTVGVDVRPHDSTSDALQVTSTASTVTPTVQLLDPNASSSAGTPPTNAPISGISRHHRHGETPRLTGAARSSNQQTTPNTSPLASEWARLARMYGACPGGPDEHDPARHPAPLEVVEQAEHAEHVAPSEGEQEEHQHARDEQRRQRPERAVDRLAAHRLVDPLDEVGDPRS